MRTALTTFARTKALGCLFVISMLLVGLLISARPVDVRARGRTTPTPAYSPTPTDSAPLIEFGELGRLPTYSVLQPEHSLGIGSATSATDLALAMGINSFDLVEATIGTSDPSGTGVFNGNLNEFPRQGNSFAILSTGLASSANTPNASESLSYQLSGLNNSQGNDLVQFTVRLRVPADKNCMSVDFAYFSEEFQEFVGSIFNDTFTAEFGGSDLTIVGNQVVAPNNFAFDAAGNIVSINTVSGATGNTGTTYDGGTVVLQAKRAVPSGQTIKVVFSVQDLGDSIYDSAVFLDNFHWLNDPECKAGSEAKPPLILVHGWQGPDVSGFDCDPGNLGASSGVVDYSRTTNATPQITYWGEMPAWLEEDYDVWVAQLKTGSQGTPALQTNARCLRNQIDYVYNSTGRRELVVVAHSMGGLVSRACLALPECGQKAKSLVTLGSPHAGLPAAGLFSILGILCNEGFELGVCQMSDIAMLEFNGFTSNRTGIDYYFFGGGTSPGLRGTLWKVLAGDNDGLVGKYSAVGWRWPLKWFVPFWWEDPSPPVQLWTDEVHSRSFSRENGVAVDNDYYNYRVKGSGVGERSYSYQCFIALLRGEQVPSGKCPDAATANQTLRAESIFDFSQFTDSLIGHLTNSQMTTETLPIDTGNATLFYLSWTTGTLELQLTRPDGQVIDPAYAASHPSEVLYESQPGGFGLPPYAAYSFTTTVPGAWQLQIAAGGVGSSGTDFRAFAALETTRTLAAGMNSDSYAVGQSATISATLQNNGVGLPSATVTATLIRPDGITDTVPLTHQGSGLYVGNYVIPDTPSFLSAAVIATGTDEGTAFSRRVDMFALIAPHDAWLTGVYSAQPRNYNGDVLYERLDFIVEISATVPGSYLLTADLSAGGQVVAQTAIETTLISGMQSIALQFNGNDIRRAQFNGPYTVSRLSLVKSDTGIRVQSVNNVWTTSDYNWQSFGGCYTLTKGVNPSFGGAVNVSPVPNCSSGTQYSIDTVVQLTAVPAPGYSFANWIVDASGEQNPIVITIDSDKIVKANMRPPKPVYLPNISRDSTSSASYDWLDATVGGTKVAQGDEIYQYVSLPFPFKFYGNTYTGLYVSSNGYITFGSGNTIYNNVCIPNTSIPNNAVYAFWDDLTPNGGSNGNVYVKQIDSATFVIEWYSVRRYASYDYETFEIVLRNNNTITLQYQSISNVGSVTVGVENASGTSAKQRVCNGVGTPLANQVAIQYSTP